jgi:hypothetical protein
MIKGKSDKGIKLDTTSFSFDFLRIGIPKILLDQRSPSA